MDIIKAKKKDIPDIVFLEILSSRKFMLRNIRIYSSVWEKMKTLVNSLILF